MLVFNPPRDIALFHRHKLYYMYTVYSNIINITLHWDIGLSFSLKAFFSTLYLYDQVYAQYKDKI